MYDTILKVLLNTQIPFNKVSMYFNILSFGDSYLCAIATLAYESGKNEKFLYLKKKHGDPQFFGDHMRRVDESSMQSRIVTRNKALFKKMTSILSMFLLHKIQDCVGKASKIAKQDRVTSNSLTLSFSFVYCFSIQGGECTWFA